MPEDLIDGVIAVCLGLQTRGAGVEQILLGIEHVKRGARYSAASSRTPSKRGLRGDDLLPRGLDRGVIDIQHRQSVPIFCSMLTTVWRRPARAASFCATARRYCAEGCHRIDRLVEIEAEAAPQRFRSPRRPERIAVRAADTGAEAKGRFHRSLGQLDIEVGDLHRMLGLADGRMGADNHLARLFQRFADGRAFSAARPTAGIGAGRGLIGLTRDLQIALRRRQIGARGCRLGDGDVGTGDLTHLEPVLGCAQFLYLKSPNGPITCELASGPPQSGSASAPV